jgi:hypothetical protein
VKGPSRAVPLTARVRRGLREVYSLSRSDYETGMSDKPPRWDAREAGEIMAAFRWLHYITTLPVDRVWPSGQNAATEGRETT